MPSLTDVINAVHDESNDTLRVSVVSTVGGGADPVGLKDTGGTPIDPATEDTLSLVELAVDDIETTLIAIKDTAGIKKITDALPAGGNDLGSVDVMQLVFIESNPFDVDNSSVQLVDCDGSGAGAPALDTNCRYVTITNAGEGDLFIRTGGSAPVADGSTAYYDFKLAKGETRWLPIGHKTATSTINDVYGIRAAAQTNDNVIVAQWAFGP